MYEIDDIKRVRKRLGMTQLDLARQASVSQSLIAKIEARRLDPTYTKVKQIFRVLEDLERKDEVSASEIMNPKVISISAGASVKEAVILMKKHQISQLPVLEQGHTVGLLSESAILDALMEGKAKIVSDIMIDAPPLVPKNARIDMVSSLLRHCPMVVVAEQGKVVGVITKSDLIGKAYKG
jgi:predicted transcriptional regulator